MEEYKEMKRNTEEKTNNSLVGRQSHNINDSVKLSFGDFLLKSSEAVKKKRELTYENLKKKIEGK